MNSLGDALQKREAHFSSAMRENDYFGNVFTIQGTPWNAAIFASLFVKRQYYGKACEKCQDFCFMPRDKSDTAKTKALDVKAFPLGHVKGWGGGGVLWLEN